MRLAIAALALSMSGCQMGVHAIGLNWSFLHSAQKMEAVTESGAYIASSSTVDFRGVEMVEALDDSFWELVGGMGAKLVGAGVFADPFRRPAPPGQARCDRLGSNQLSLRFLG